MQTVRIFRHSFTSFGTYGDMTLPDGQVLKTVENPWLFNQPVISCIPRGTYRCVKREYFHGGYDTFEITDVEGRKYILIHIANSPVDVKGCIGVGLAFGWVKEQWAVTASKKAFAIFWEQMKDEDEFTLIIEERCPQA